MNPAQSRQYLTRKAASEYLHSIGCPIASSTLAKLACREGVLKGPPYIKIGWRIVRYRKEDLQIWAIKVTQNVGSRV